MDRYYRTVIDITVIRVRRVVLVLYSSLYPVATSAKDYIRTGLPVVATGGGTCTCIY